MASSLSNPLWVSLAALAWCRFLIRRIRSDRTAGQWQMLPQHSASSRAAPLMDAIQQPTAFRSAGRAPAERAQEIFPLITLSSSIPMASEGRDLD